MRRHISIIVLLIITVTSFCACNSGYDRDISLGIIGGRHSNLAECDNPTIEFEDTDVENAFLHKKDRVKHIFGIVPDSNPTKNYSEVSQETLANYSKSVKSKRWDTAQKDAISFIDEFSTQSADDEEVDTLSAFYAIANEFSQQSENCCKRILVFDSGLCTCGALNFIENASFRGLIEKNTEIFDEEIKPIVETLKINKELPDLSDVQIRWYGIGMVGGKQSELTKVQISNLTAIWESILCESGAQVEFVNVNKSSVQTNDEDLPDVSVVSFYNAISLGEKELGFKSGTDEFLDHTEAKRKEVLSEFVSEGKNMGLLLVGTVSSGGAQASEAEDFILSQKRANAVKSELVALGVPENMMKAIGLGTKSHKYDPNEFVNGEYMEFSEAAIANRSVYIMVFNCDEAKVFECEYLQLIEDGSLVDLI